MRAVLFDFDGVLVDSISAHLEAWKQATFDLFGSDLEAEFVKTLSGHATVYISRLITEKLDVPHKQQELAETKKSIMMKSPRVIQPLPGAYEIITYVKSHSIPYAVCSNAGRDYIAKTLNTLELDCPVFFGHEDVQNPKPAPDLYLLGAKTLKVPVSEHPSVIVFEDSLHGMQAAIKAGMRGIGVMTQESKEDFASIGCHETCKSLADFMATIC
jgi:beta-phosphoglucomutase